MVSGLNGSLVQVKQGLLNNIFNCQAFWLVIFDSMLKIDNLYSRSVFTLFSKKLDWNVSMNDKVVNTCFILNAIILFDTLLDQRFKFNNNFFLLCRSLVTLKSRRIPVLIQNCVYFCGCIFHFRGFYWFNWKC